MFTIMMVQNITAKSCQLMGLSSVGTATQRCSVVCSDGHCRRPWKVSSCRAAHLLQHRSRTSRRRVSLQSVPGQRSCSTRCQQEDSVHAAAEVDEATSTSGTVTEFKALLLPLCSTCSAAHVAKCADATQDLRPCLRRPSPSQRLSSQTARGSDGAWLHGCWDVAAATRSAWARRSWQRSAPQQLGSWVRFSLWGTLS